MQKDKEWWGKVRKFIVNTTLPLAPAKKKKVVKKAVKKKGGSVASVALDKHKVMSKIK